MHTTWIDQFRAETGEVLRDPFWLCLAASIAAVESGWGAHTLRGPDGFNEIGYKAIPGRPALTAPTREADAAGRLQTTQAAFRLFADRREQATALRHLFGASSFYEAARLLFVLVFYAAYAPGRTAGARALLRVFNQLSRGGTFGAVRPFALAEPGGSAGETARLNHAAAREGVRLFAELTRAAEVGR